jgi:Spy/CpxP family protein refolding chaperone
MRIRTTILAATIAILPALAVAQTATPEAGSATTAAPSTMSPSTGSATGTPRHHNRAEWQNHRAEMRQKYEQLSAADKAKVDELGKQIRDLRQQRMQILGLKKS